MRLMSCNGCRVLRKGCTDACTIRPCLQWIKSPDAQANATVFLAKFYGRAGLLNLLNAAADDIVRPAVFRSLLYEACGRTVNPVYGAVGLLWSGKWHMCQAAVEAVLNGQPIVQVDSSSSAADGAGELIQTPAAASSYDIRHVFPKSMSMSMPSSNKQPLPPAAAPPAATVDAAAAQDKDSHKQPHLKRTSSSSPPPFKAKRKTTTQNNNPKPPHHAAASPATQSEEQDDDDDMVVAVAVDHSQHQQEQVHNSKSRASSDDYDHHSALASLDTTDTDTEAASHVSQAEELQTTTSTAQAVAEDDDHQLQEAEQQPLLGLDLTLGSLVSGPTPTAACRQARRGGSSAADEPGVIGFRLFL